MTPEQRALEIIEPIYQAPTDPDGWSLVVEKLSAALGQASVALVLNFPEVMPPARTYAIGFKPEYGALFAEYHAKGLPWEKGFLTCFVGRFGRANEVFPDELLPETEFYREWMEPQGLAPVGPIVHTIAAEKGRRVAGVGAYQRADGRAFDAEDLALCDLLVPHFARAFALSRQLSGMERQRIALAEVVDRLPTGLILLDSHRKALVTNRSADRIVAQHDGLELDRKGPHAADPRDDLALQQAIQTALDDSQSGRASAGAVTSISRPSGRRPFAAFVIALLEGTEQTLSSEAVAAVFVTDPDAGQVTTIEVLQGLYALTRAEAELVQFLARGYSLDEVASLRGVTVNTARSQLKQVFAKTDTRRQGELVRLVLTGITSIGE